MRILKKSVAQAIVAASVLGCMAAFSKPAFVLCTATGAKAGYMSGVFESSDDADSKDSVRHEWIEYLDSQNLQHGHAQCHMSVDRARLLEEHRVFLGDGMIDTAWGWIRPPR
jgi:hypothetical protein